MKITNCRGCHLDHVMLPAMHSPNHIAVYAYYIHQLSRMKQVPDQLDNSGWMHQVCTSQRCTSKDFPNVEGFQSLQRTFQQLGCVEALAWAHNQSNKVCLLTEYFIFVTRYCTLFNFYGTPCNTMSLCSRSVVGVICEAPRRKKVNQILTVYSMKGKTFINHIKNILERFKGSQVETRQIEPTRSFENGETSRTEKVGQQNKRIW